MDTLIPSDLNTTKKLVVDAYNLSTNLIRTDMDKELNDNQEEIDYESLPNTSTAIHLSAGAIAGIMEHCVVYPIDSVKVCSLINF